MTQIQPDCLKVYHFENFIFIFCIHNKSSAEFVINMQLKEELHLKPNLIKLLTLIWKIM